MISCSWTGRPGRFDKYSAREYSGRLRITPLQPELNKQRNKSTSVLAPIYYELADREWFEWAVTREHNDIAVR